MPPRKKRTSWQLGYWPLAVLVISGGVLLIIGWANLAARRWSMDFAYPFVATPSVLADTLHDESLALKGARALAFEVENLRRENALLTARAARMDELERENGELRAAGGMAPPAQYRYRACEIILRDPVGWNEHFTISAGSDSGVLPGAAVLALVPGEDGLTVTLVGVVRTVSRHSARVVTLLNPELKLSARLPEADEVGFVNAEGAGAASTGLVELNYLPVKGNYLLGERLETTGLEAMVPGGIAMGRLAELEPVNQRFGNTAYRRGFFQPLADIGKLRLLLVVVLDRQSEPPAAP